MFFRWECRTRCAPNTCRFFRTAAGFRRTPERGWGLAREESHAGLTAVGSAILDKASHPIAAISVSFFDYPPNPKRLNQLATVVMAVAEEASKRIAEYGNYGASLTRRPRVAVAAGPEADDPP